VCMRVFHAGCKMRQHRAKAAVLLSLTMPLLSLKTEPRRPMKVVTTAAGPCAHSHLPPVFFLLTTTPDRADRLGQVMATMRLQTLRPKAVVLTTAKQYNTSRFSKTTVTVPKAVTEEQRPSLVMSPPLKTDLGPIAKYYGAAILDPGAIVVVGDDDMFYGSTFIEDYACAVAQSEHNVVFSSGIDRDCKPIGSCVMGFRGVGLRAGMLHRLFALQVPDACFLADDVAITFFLVRMQRYQIRRLKLRSKYRFDDAFAWSNSSINTYHRQHKFRINKACGGSLRTLAAAMKLPHPTKDTKGPALRRRQI